MKRARLERIVQRNGHIVSRGTRMPKPGMAPFLTVYRVSDLLERADETVARHAPRQFHAASSGISSSFT
jgi:hypothetical protein